jgi:hypothetical protein
MFPIVEQAYAHVYRGALHQMVMNSGDHELLALLEVVFSLKGLKFKTFRSTLKHNWIFGCKTWSSSNEQKCTRLKIASNRMNILISGMNS